MNKQSGFTLVEVLVASAIVIMSMGTLLQLFSSGLDRNYRVAEQAQLLVAQRSLVAMMDQVNPAAQKEGKGEIESLEYRWQATQSKPYQTIYEQESHFPRELALFNIEIQINKPRGDVYTFNLQQLGWRNKK
jgi:prepilin-type N-terminal cleavage/methylation domain-containing protein